MVSLQIVEQSNALIANLPKGLVAVFIGATSGIGQATLQNFAQHARSPRIYSVARPVTVASHETFLTSVRESSPTGTYNLITADVSLVAEVGKVVKAIKEKETKIDFLFLSPGFMPLEGRHDTSEGLEPSMTTRYYSRVRAIQQLLPLLNSDDVASPRIVSVLAGGMEGPLIEDDLDVRDPSNWDYWKASLHTASMSTLSLERFARENPRVSIVHVFPGAVATPLLARMAERGITLPNVTTPEESGARTVFLATNDRYAVKGGRVPTPEGLEAAKTTGGGIFLVGPEGEISDNEKVLAPYRERGLDEVVWKHTEAIFASAEASRAKDDL